MDEAKNRIIRQQTAPIKAHLSRISVKSVRMLGIEKKNYKESLRMHMIKGLRMFKKQRTSFSPDSTRFIRKKENECSGRSLRKISIIKQRQYPSPLSPKELSREFMNRDERRLLDSLFNDQKKYQEEIQSNLGLTMFHLLKPSRISKK